MLTLEATKVIKNIAIDTLGYIAEQMKDRATVNVSFIGSGEEEILSTMISDKDRPSSEIGEMLAAFLHVGNLRSVQLNFGKFAINFIYNGVTLTAIYMGSCIFDTCITNPEAAEVVEKIMGHISFYGNIPYLSDSK